MPKKQARPGISVTGRSAKPKRGPAKARVTTKISLDRETIEMLSDVALARRLVDVANASKGKKIMARDRKYSVAKVIEDLIESHHAALKAEAHTVKGGPRRT